MRYLLLIYQNEAEHAKLSQEELGAEYGAYMAFGEEAQKRGVFLSGEALAAILSIIWLFPEAYCADPLGFSPCFILQR
jgi:hypothetical protein